MRKVKRYVSNLGLLFSSRENVFNSFKRRLFPIKKLDKIPTGEPTQKQTAKSTPTKHEKLKLKLQQEFMNKIIVDGKR